MQTALDCVETPLQQVPCEEFPVTFQVGMVAKDGVLLASDKRCVVPGDAYSVRHSFESDKILISQDGLLACCVAGNDLTEEVGIAIISEVKAERPPDSIKRFDEDFKDSLKDCARSVSQRQQDNVSLLGGGHILVARNTGSDVQLWGLQLRGGSMALPHHIHNKFYQGDQANSAVFFSERYFPKNHRELPLRHLRLLAAHIVLTAEAMHTSGISGLDIVECTVSGFRKLTDEELLPLMIRSQQLSDQIRDALFDSA